MHATLFLGCTVCCGSFGTMRWDREVIVFTHLPPHTAATAIQRVYRSYVDKVIKEYLPPHTAATAIQRVYRSYVDKVITEWLQSRHDLSVCDSYWIPRWDDG